MRSKGINSQATTNSHNNQKWRANNYDIVMEAYYSVGLFYKIDIKINFSYQ